MQREKEFSEAIQMKRKVLVEIISRDVKLGKPYHLSIL